MTTMNFFHHLSQECLQRWWPGTLAATLRVGVMTVFSEVCGVPLSLPLRSFTNSVRRIAHLIINPSVRAKFQLTTIFNRH